MFSRRLLVLLGVLGVTAVAVAQIRDSNGALVVPQLSGNANDVLKGDGTFGAAGGAGEGVPQGAILLILSGACPTGFEEATELNGKTIIGTVAANKDVGTTGGSDTITPEGTNSALTFTGTPFSSVINHTHTVNVNDPGHAHPEGYRNTGTAGTAGVQGASTANNASIAGGVLSATTGITATTANPAGGVASITPAGTINTPTFAGTQFDNRSAWIKVIACRKT